MRQDVENIWFSNAVGFSVFHADCVSKARCLMLLVGGRRMCSFLITAGVWHLCVQRCCRSCPRSCRARRRSLERRTRERVAESQGPSAWVPGGRCEQKPSSRRSGGSGFIGGGRSVENQTLEEWYPVVGTSSPWPWTASGWDWPQQSSDLRGRRRDRQKFWFLCRGHLGWSKSTFPPCCFVWQNRLQPVVHHVRWKRWNGSELQACYWHQKADLDVIWHQDWAPRSGSRHRLRSRQCEGKVEIYRRNEVPWEDDKWRPERLWHSRPGHGSNERGLARWAIFLLWDFVLFLLCLQWRWACALMATMKTSNEDINAQ